MPAGSAGRILEEFRRHCAVVPPAMPPPGLPLHPADREKLRALGYAQ
jgi:hypothetical protein